MLVLKGLSLKMQHSASHVRHCAFYYCLCGFILSYSSYTAESEPITCSTDAGELYRMFSVIHKASNMMFVNLQEHVLATMTTAVNWRVVSVLAIHQHAFVMLTVVNVVTVAVTSMTLAVLVCGNNNSSMTNIL